MTCHALLRAILMMLITHNVSVSACPFACVCVCVCVCVYKSFVVGYKVSVVSFRFSTSLRIVMNIYRITINLPVVIWHQQQHENWLTVGNTIQTHTSRARERQRLDPAIVSRVIRATRQQQGRKKGSLPEYKYSGTIVLRDILPDKLEGLCYL
jgi:hypothetical protein